MFHPISLNVQNPDVQHKPVNTFVSGLPPLSSPCPLPLGRPDTQANRDAVECTVHGGQPRSQGLSSSRPRKRERGVKRRDPGNEVAWRRGEDSKQSDTVYLFGAYAVELRRATPFFPQKLTKSSFSAKGLRLWLNKR